jgi:hypothetical protein
MGRDSIENVVLDGIEDVLSQNVTIEKVRSRLMWMAELETTDADSQDRLLSQEMREVEAGIQRILTAIEKGARYEMYAAKFKELSDRKASI